MMASPIRCLVTAGPTREYFDPVRFLSNPSSGKMGYALARAAKERGWDVDLVTGPVQLTPPEGVRLHKVITGEDMFHSVSRLFPDCHILIMTAAIMDYRPKSVANHKIKKFELDMFIEMEPVVDVLATIARDKTRQVVVGFAAETDHLEEYALRKLEGKNADFIVANRIGGPKSAFEGDENEVLVLRRTGDPVSLGPMPKEALARALVEMFAPSLKESGSPD